MPVCDAGSSQVERQTVSKFNFGWFSGSHDTYQGQPRTHYSLGRSFGDPYQSVMRPSPEVLEHRILLKLSGYSPNRPLDGGDLDCLGCYSRLVGGEALRFYRHGIALVSADGAMERINYDEIRSVRPQCDEHKCSVRITIASHRSDIAFQIENSGRYSEGWEILRFLMRVRGN
jgi:hypothetical protein